MEGAASVTLGSKQPSTLPADDRIKTQTETPISLPNRDAFAAGVGAAQKRLANGDRVQA